MMQLPEFFKSPQELAKLPTDTPVLAALSGGADSTALLHLLCCLREKIPFPLYAAHINHNIRTEHYGNEALRDEQFCRRLCEELKVPLFVHSIDLPALAEESGESLETEARNLRYRFFAALMTEHQIPILATAHNANDNLETQIFNLCRGCGIDGICGIPEARAFPQGKGLAVRPILSATKSQILKLCTDNHLDYVTDSTNFEADCTRNAIRHNVIPTLQALFKSPEKAGLRLSALAYEDADYLKQTASILLQKQKGKLTADFLKDLHPAITKRILRLQFAAISSATLEEVHLSDMLSLIQRGHEGFVSLPNMMRMRLSGGQITFEDDHREKKTFCEYQMLLTEGTTMLCSEKYAIHLSKNGESPFSDDNYLLLGKAELAINAQSALFARNRREGDRILDNGMHKKVKKLFCDFKISEKDRDLPLICQGNEILYIPGIALSDQARIHNKNQEKCTLTVYKKYN